MLPACFSAELTSASTYTFIIPVIGFIAGVLLLRHRPSTDRDFLTTCAEACKEFFLYSGGMEGASGYYYFESRLLKPTADLLLSYRWMGVAVIYASAVIMLSLLYSYTTGRANENVLQLVPTIALVGVSRYFGVRSWWRLWVLRLRLARTGRLKVLKPVGDGGLYGRIYRLAARTGPAVRYVVAGICGVILLNTGLSGVKLAPMAAFGILLTSISILKFLKLKRSVEEEAFRILKDRRLRIRILNPLRYREILTVTLSDYMGMRGARSPREAAALLLEDLRIGRIKLEEIEPDTEAQPPNNNSPSPLRMEILRPRDGKVHHA
ncbi:MAG: hypothetical protein DRN81_05600 [Thermoproteota archaeon]|nr:MAG: hypothetical protein DRN81_05600 [Candidatus Korarchaeota archaeon]